MRKKTNKKIGFFEWNNSKNDSLKPCQILSYLDYPLQKMIIHQNYAISQNGKNKKV